MNYEQKRQYIKNVALNKIQSVMAGNIKYDQYSSESQAEQEVNEIAYILRAMNNELYRAKMKVKLKKEKQNVVEQ